MRSLARTHTPVKFIVHLKVYVSPLFQKQGPKEQVKVSELLAVTLRRLGCEVRDEIQTIFNQVCALTEHFACVHIVQFSNNDVHNLHVDCVFHRR